VPALCPSKATSNRGGLFQFQARVCRVTLWKVTPHAQAQAGLKQIEDAIVALLKQHGGWMSRAHIARKLDIESFYKGGHGGYLSGGMCRGLVDQGILETKGGGGPGQKTFYRIKSNPSAPNGVAT